MHQPPKRWRVRSRTGTAFPKQSKVFGVRLIRAPIAHHSHDGAMDAKTLHGSRGLPMQY